MGNIFKIKRRTTGSAGAPATIAHGELAFNEVGEAFYYGKASNASSAIGGKGEFLDKSTSQTVAGNKTFTSNVVLSSAVTITQVTTATDTYLATTEFVQNVFSVLDGGNFDDAGGGGGGGNMFGPGDFGITFNGYSNEVGTGGMILGFSDQSTWPAGTHLLSMEYSADGVNWVEFGTWFASHVVSSNYVKTASMHASSDGDYYVRVYAKNSSSQILGTSNIIQINKSTSLVDSSITYTLLNGAEGDGSFAVTYNGPANNGTHDFLIGFDQNNWPAGATRFAVELSQVGDFTVDGSIGTQQEGTVIAQTYNYELPLAVFGEGNGDVYIRVYALDSNGYFQGGSLNSGTILATSSTLRINKTNGVYTLISGNSGGGNNGGGNTPVTGQYYYSVSSSDWYTVSNWWGDSSHTQQAATLPLSSTNVVIVNGSVEPVVSLDNANWVQPASIDSGSVGITFTSQNFGNVTCSISGEATFEGNSTYNV